MNNPAFTDLHTHFLPGMDDGAKNIEMTQALLEQYQRNGVSRVMATPHFNYERTSLEEFVWKRNEAEAQARNLIEQSGCSVELKAGAEVMFTSALPSLDLSQLSLGGGDYILVEFSTAIKPVRISHVLYDVLQQGYTPIIAHVERYPYVTEKPDQLYEWVKMGCLAHINARALLQGGKTEKMARKYLERNLAHFVATDAHHPEKRPVNLAEAMERLPSGQASRLNRNAQRIFNNGYLQPPQPEKLRKLFGFL